MKNTIRKSIRPTLLAIAIAQTLAAPGTQAASIVVDEIFELGAGCTLREAVTSINTGVLATGCINSGGPFGTDDQIRFSVATVSLSNGELNINADLSIIGGSVGVTINGNASSRLLNLDASGTNIVLDKLTLSGGNAFSLNGGAIYAKEVRLRLNNSTISGNGADGGGGIFAWYSTVNLSNSVVSGNYAANGGGIAARTSNISLSNSTVSGNSAGHSGGGISTFLSSSVSLSNSTVSGNDADYDGGGIRVHSSSVIFSNSIVANSGNGDCVNNASSITADNHNIIEDGSCDTSALSVDPKLGPLKNNGGPTRTHALLAGSPAIDAGDNAVCAAPPVNNLDQRGERRPVGSACDIGAYEFRKKKSYFVIPLPNGKTFIFNL